MKEVEENVLHANHDVSAHKKQTDYHANTDDLCQQLRSHNDIHMICTSQAGDDDNKQRSFTICVTMNGGVMGLEHGTVDTKDGYKYVVMYIPHTSTVVLTHLFTTYTYVLLFTVPFGIII